MGNNNLGPLRLAVEAGAVAAAAAAAAAAAVAASFASGSLHSLSF